MLDIKLDTLLAVYEEKSFSLRKAESDPAGNQ